ncbi:MAG: thiamine-phosphate kinase [Deltaproteobacteria bacterium]|nr:thiamine-phosphate kinase [Deltaproteobacteria bacterium]
MKRVKEIGEDGLIKLLAERYAGKSRRRLTPIGDDTSVTSQRKGFALLATTDTLSEGIHFVKSLGPPRLLGKKALSISLSDIAAMGGTPLFYLASIALPENTPLGYVDSIYEGMNARADEFSVFLAGGNTVRSKTGIAITTVVIGETPLKRVVLRSTARANDIIYVTGTPGDSALGLKVLMNHGIKRGLQGPFKKAALKHLDPPPRVSLGKILSKKKLATAMIDVSDGLILDLSRLAKASGAGAVIRLEKLLLSKDVLRYAGKDRLRGCELALAGGEDYELLFTARPGAARRLSSISKSLNIPITPIGKITGKGKAVAVLDENNREITFKKAGYEHF